MSYVYEEFRPYVFSEEAQEKLLDVIRCARRCIVMAGAVAAGKLLDAAGSGDSWQLMALVDRLVELKYLRYVDTTYRVAWQDQVLVQGEKALP